MDIAERSATAAEKSMDIAKVTAESARDSVLESRKARQDALATDVFVRVSDKIGTRWIARSHGTQVSAARPMETILNSPANDEDQVLVGAILILKNRSPFDALMEIRAARVDNIRPAERLSGTSESPAFGSIDNHIPNGVFVIEPGGERFILVRQGPTLTEWMMNHSGFIGVEILSHRTLEGAKQRWTLEFPNAQLLGGDPDNHSAFRVQPFLQVETKLQLQNRIYPI